MSEAKRARQRRYYARHKDRERARVTEWRKNNPKFVKRQHRLWKLQSVLGVSRAEARAML